MSEIQKQVSVLWDLKKVAEQIHRIQLDLVRIPADIKRLQASLEQAKSIVDSEKAKIVALEKKGREAERDAKIEEELAQKSESKMRGVTNSNTLQAATKEHQEHKKAKARLEEEAFKTLSELETKKAQLAGFEAQYLETEKKTLDECAVLETEVEKLKAEVTKLESLQGELTKGLSGNISTIYSRLTRAGKGAPVAQVADGLCQSCHMKVRPQLYNEVIGFKQIHQCSSCGKLLVTPVPETKPTTPLEA